MIVWSGAGALALLFFAGAQALAYGLSRVMPFDHYAYGIPVACIVAGLATWVTGRRLNGRGRAPKHTLYDVRMEYWGVIFSVIILWMWRNYLQ